VFLWGRILAHCKKYDIHNPVHHENCCETGESLVRAVMSQLNLSARAYHRSLKLARTIADLAGSDQIQTSHVAEALQYRPKGLTA